MQQIEYTEFETCSFRNVRETVLGPPHFVKSELTFCKVKSSDYYIRLFTSVLHFKDAPCPPNFAIFENYIPFV
jgi:hypothetical protein